MANAERHVEIESCPICRKGAMTEIRSAESCFFEFATCHLLRCENQNCNSYAWGDFFEKVDKLQEEGAYASLERLKAHSPLPTELVSDFREALTCFHAGTYHATVVMTRRTLERALLLKGAKQCRAIVDMIADLAQQGRISSEVEDLCDEVRVLGKFGAHPKEELNQSDAVDALNFTDLIITWLYKGELYK